MSEITETQLWEWMMEGNYPPHYHDGDHLAFCVKLDRQAIATLDQDVEYRETITRTVQVPAIRKGFRQPSNNRTRATQWRNRKNSPPAREIEEEVSRTLPKGTKVKVVMASRMGDVGITPNLDAQAGYVARINCIEGDFDMFGDGKTIVPLKPEGVLSRIEPLEDSRADRVALVFPEGCKAPEDF